MAAVGQNTFDITGASQLTEEGFSRIPRGMHHHHATTIVEEPSTNTTTLREYIVVATLDLTHIGPQIIEKFKVNCTNQFAQDLAGLAVFDDTRKVAGPTGTFELFFSTSLPTELSALDKSVSPFNFDYTTRQYRLEKWTGTQTNVLWIDGANTANGGGAGLSMQIFDPSNIAWINSGWQSLETKPLVVSTTLMLGFRMELATPNIVGWNTDKATTFEIEFDVLTRDHPMSNEDIWFARKLFNQGPENRFIYYRTAQE